MVRRTDFRDDEVDGHFATEEMLESFRVGEEGASSEILELLDDAPGKWSWSYGMMRWGRSTREGTLYRTKRARANLTYLFAASVRSEETQIDMVTVRTIIK